MFIRFKVKNFLSFKEMTEISMIKGKTKNKFERVYIKNDLKVLKFAAIFGANASGKSNIVKAINFAQRCIVREIPDYNRELYFKGDSKTFEKLPAYFEFEILIDENIYSYGFEIDLSFNKIVSEWLYCLKSTVKEEVLFNRDLKNKEYEINIKNIASDLNNKIQVYFDDLKDNEDILFLTEMNHLKEKLYKDKTNIQIFKDIYDWFEDKLMVYGSNDLNSGYVYLLNKKYNTQIVKTLKFLNTGIIDYTFEKFTIDDMLSKLPKFVASKLIKDIEDTRKSWLKLSDTAKERELTEGLNGGAPVAGFRSRESFCIITITKDGEIFASEIKLKHRNSLYDFGFKEESAGTRILFDLMEILFNEDNKFYIIDELDRSLHPQLTYKFIQLFLDLAKSRNAQLMVTTHESRLLDFDLLRQDEIWLVDKDSFGVSKIYSLDEYNVRYDKKIDKAYLEGRYGGVPIFNTIFPIEGV